ncbi:alpha-ribazole phosphatase [Carboxylicivirga sp. A043]|uniref:alpha-ribazole phosphatase n=1 Tax=Carboxylicivirga litoralis TaxID=2816963 RepID=UPI0021CB0F6B|nr:alpha-ribazole phosphatase [Carboxylicivirga sp. A043]MCU4157650.1 alpha-ribazole phosphatase [Carboxylicivirga sp. A043]
MEIWLIRHTTPQVDNGVCYGQLDLDVIDSFIEEAGLIKQHVEGIQFDKVYSSPLVRCKKLADKLPTSNSIIYDKRLKEIDFGQWEGLAWKSIPHDEMEQWSADYVNNTAPDGESFGQLIERTNDFIAQLGTASDEKVAVITHSGIIRAFLVKYLQIPATKIFSLDLSFGCIVKIIIHSKEYQQVKFITA